MSDQPQPVPVPPGQAPVVPSTPSSERLAAVPGGWLRADYGGSLRVGAVGLGLGALAMFMSAISTIANPEAEHPERGWISGTVLAVLAFACWALGSARHRSRKAPRLANAVDFTNASVAPADSWVHFAAFRAVRWPVLIVFIIFGLAAGVLAVIFAIFPPRFAPEPQWLVQIVVWVVALVCAGLCALFLLATVNTFRTQRANAGWPMRYGITLGESGLALRLAGLDREVPWDDIVSIDAAVTKSSDKGPHVPIIELDWATIDDSARRKVTHGRINIDNLDVAPRMLYTALRFYWSNPGARAELGTTFAQRRMEAWARAPH